jgi:uncharacterized membrane protein YbhN (UPF0104 family)
MNDDADINAVIRDRSRRFVMAMFATFALMFAALALAAHWLPQLFSIASTDMPQIAASFLFLASAYTLTMFIWDLLFPANDE